MAEAEQEQSLQEKNKALEEKKGDLMRLVTELLVERGAPADSKLQEAVIEALPLLPSRHGLRYFLGSPPALQRIAEIDAVREGTSATTADACAAELFGDFFLVCTALKPTPGAPSTVKDPNFDLGRVNAFFKALSPEGLAVSVQALGRLAFGLTETGCAELGKSASRLRALLVMLSHPGLAEPSSEALEALQRVLEVVGQVHADKDARELLAQWIARFPLEFLEQLVGQAQQFMTLSLLEAQAEVTGQSPYEQALEMGKRNGLSRHVRNALRLLNICWTANEKRREYSEDWRTRRRAQQLREVGQLVEDEGLRMLLVGHFHNDAVNECEGILKHDLKEVLEMQSRGQYFSVMEEGRRIDFGIVEFPFVLTPVSKVRLLHIESLVLQREEVRHAMQVAMMMSDGRAVLNPFLVLKVRRTAVVQDALQQLASCGARSYKKPLKIVFDGEEGVDEGGVQKEFFQLLVEELYQEDFGMFERVEESRSFWFNKNSFEANLQFELFGTVLGLAIYNQVILDAKFPTALYKKLINTRTKLGLSDLVDFQPSLAKGFISLLEHDPATFEETFAGLNFVVNYDCYGSQIEVELMEGGRNTAVTAENREEYVEMYCDWIFNKAVEKQYGAFRRGFDQCIAGTLFRQLFRHDELELVICGTVDLDFHALEGSTQYQDGFTPSSNVVRWFWEVAHSLTDELKRNLLQFCTGCDRAPVGGLGRLQFVISRGGPDSDMLPWVHTCFNHLLLPDYSSKDKLEQRLRLAIQHSTGFGLM